jgi:hypothetical protein
MGSVISVQSPGSEQFPASTIGGIISVAGHLYGLTVAHSIFRKPSTISSVGATSSLRVCGHVESYEWSGNEKPVASDIRVLTVPPLLRPTADIARQNMKRGRITTAMDWMMIRLQRDFMLPNMYKDVESQSICIVDGGWPNTAFGDGEVVVCGGITGTQVGIISSLISSIIYGEASYEVISVALEYPLGML